MAEDGASRSDGDRLRQEVTAGRDVYAARHQTVYITPETQSVDVGLMIRLESENVALDRDNRLYLEITNRTSAPKRLSINVEGVRKTVATVLPDNLVELAGRTTVERVLTLRCTATDPMAGSLPLQVVLTDADTGKVCLQSGQVTVVVPSRPRLTCEVVPPARVSLAGRYRAVVRLANLGNAHLRGTVRAFDVPESDINCLGAGHVRLGDGRFDLSPGEQRDLPIELDFPGRHWTNRTWQVLVGADVEDHEEIRGSEASGREITQAGLWSSFRSHMAQHQQVRRRSLVLGGFLVLVAGVLTGQSVVPGSEVPAGARGSSPEPAVESSTANELPYVKMPCQTGTSVAFLKPLEADDTRDHGSWLLENESRRLQPLTTRVPILRNNRVQVQISRRDQVCPSALDEDEYRPHEKYTAFIWVGPIPTTEGTELCNGIGKPLAHDCLPVATTQ